MISPSEAIALKRKSRLSLVRLVVKQFVFNGIIVLLLLQIPSLAKASLFWLWAILPSLWIWVSCRTMPDPGNPELAGQEFPTPGRALLLILIQIAIVCASASFFRSPP